MPLIYRARWNAAEWGVWEILESESELWKSASLSTNEERYVRRIAHPRRRLEALAARVLRDFLEGGAHFSLSHSFPWAAAIRAPHPVAIDIERLRVFPAVEVYFMNNADFELVSIENFTKWHVWCAKEVAYKLLCSRYDNLSFKREFSFLGEVVEFRRGNDFHRIQVSFEEKEEWLVAIGREIS
ncbi:MAG: hypothetical protein RMJ66_03445 [Bacteroidia bacterium]|nr:hypothetical protein [Bacteroidia bacterium]MDW8134101.1 hypothetical protein [Bacteroidia bacterium]